MKGGWHLTRGYVPGSSAKILALSSALQTLAMKRGNQPTAELPIRAFPYGGQAVFKITINDATASKYINKLRQLMSKDYMRAGEDASEPTNPFEETPFNRISEVELSSDDWIDVILSEADKIRRTAKSRDNIASDDAVIDALALPRETIDAETFYVHKVGPVAATCDDLTWKSAYTLNLEAAPEPNSNEFKEAASELRIPNSAALKLGPKFVASAYRELYEHTAETGRPIHPVRLKYEANVRLPERGYSQAFRFLNQLPGVEAPADSVAWEYEQPDSINSKEGSHA